MLSFADGAQLQSLREGNGGSPWVPASLPLGALSCFHTIWSDPKAWPVQPEKETRGRRRQHFTLHGEAEGPLRFS